MQAHMYNLPFTTLYPYILPISLYKESCCRSAGVEKDVTHCKECHDGKNVEKQNL